MAESDDIQMRRVGDSQEEYEDALNDVEVGEDDVQMHRVDDSEEKYEDEDEDDNEDDEYAEGLEHAFGNSEYMTDFGDDAGTADGGQPCMDDFA